MRLFPILFLFGFFISCSSEEDGGDAPVFDPKVELAEFLPALNEFGLPLGEDPLNWTDEELHFLDKYADAHMLGLGESTHGTAEFFDAKFRMLRYMVEQHGFKGIAMEADFGESIYLNRLLASGEIDKVAEVMQDKMLFWTWNNVETRRMIEWMVEYNEDKAPSDRIHYVGVDCQSNVHNTVLLQEYIDTYDPGYGGEIWAILNQIKTNSQNRTELEPDLFNVLRSELDSVRLTLLENEQVYPDETSHQLYLHLIEVIRQVMIVEQSSFQNTTGENLRDKYMADNTQWYYNHLGRKGLVIWAHNFHVANDESYRSMGRDLRRDLGDNYGIIGFAFSTGSFRAVHKVGETWLGLKTLTIDQAPLTSSFNGKLHYADLEDYVINMKDLLEDAAWNNYFREGIRMLSIGSTYLDSPDAHYRWIDNEDFDEMIYIRSTRAASPF